MTQQQILKSISKKLKSFDKKLPGIQDEIWKEIQLQIKRLDLDGTRIKTTVKNLSILNSIKNKVNRLVLTPDYLKEVKEFAKFFNEVYKSQNEYWQAAEQKFTPRPLLKAVKNQAITDTVASLTESGIGANISDPIVGILRQNITTGGSYAQLAQQLRQSILNTDTEGTLSKYVKQITNDSIQQFNRQYLQIVSSDLGYEWFRYMNTDIETTRCFCDALTDLDFFHVSEVPDLLKGKGLKCKGEPVKIYERTNLPYGMIEGTNPENFFIRAGGYNCRHSIQPVNIRQVPIAAQERVFNSTAYKNWKAAQAS